MSELRNLRQTVERLEQRLAAVEDVRAIQNLKSHYVQLADSRYDRNGVVDSDALDRIARDVSTLFSEDAIWDGGSGLGICRGRQAIYERFREPTLKFSWHYFVKPRIDVDGDTAQATWDILAPCTTRAGRPMWMAGTEDDEYEKRDGAWLHKSMKLTVVFMAPHDQGWGKQ